MSCYLRHLRGLLDEAGIEVKSGNRKRVDEAIHQVVRVEYKDCPTTWEKVKGELQDEEERRLLIERLQIALK